MKRYILLLVVAVLCGCVTPKQERGSFLLGAASLPGHRNTREFQKFTYDQNTNVSVMVYLGAGSVTNRLPSHINDREFQKFTLDSDSNVVIRVIMSNFTQSVNNAESDPIFTNWPGYTDFTQSVNNAEADPDFVAWLATNIVFETYILTTTNATATDLASISALSNTTYRIEAQVIGVTTNGGDRALYHREGLFYRITGDVTQQGSTVSIAEVESTAAWGCTLNADTNTQTIDLRVQGATGTNVNWTGTITYIGVAQ